MQDDMTQIYPTKSSGKLITGIHALVPVILAISLILLHLPTLLTPTYHFRAVASNSKGTDYGLEMQPGTQPHPGKDREAKIFYFQERVN
jgi:hypothetical protein